MRYLLDKLHSELLAGSLYTGSDGTIVSQIFGGTLQSDVSVWWEDGVAEGV